MPSERSRGRGQRKSTFRKDGTSVWTHAAISGPGVWATCIKGKERQCVGELYDVFESVANELYPDLPPSGSSLLPPDGTPAPKASDVDMKDQDDEDDSSDEDNELSIEQQISQELTKLKAPRKQQRFSSSNTNTPCVVFISVKVPIDPVKLVETHIETVIQTGITRTRHTHRLVPSSGTCSASNMHDMKSLLTKFAGAWFAEALKDDPERKFSYKLELRIRNHNTFDRPTFLKELATCIPPQHVVELKDPEVFVLIEVFKSICGISIVRDYYKREKFNVIELAQKTGASIRGNGNDEKENEVVQLPVVPSGEVQ